MKHNQLKTTLSVLAFAGVALFSSCKKDRMMPKHQKHQKHQMKATKTIVFENITTPKHFVQSGTFQGEIDPKTKLPLILPGQNVSFKFNAGKGQALMFATMYGASKDWFFASRQPGIQLFDEKGKAITGDVSQYITLWDNGTKHNETGAPESMPIMTVKNIKPSELMKVTLAYEEAASEFTITIENISKGTMNETPFSPGVWAVSNFDGKKLLAQKPFFKAGELTNPAISDLAQMGQVAKLKKMLDDNTGIITGLSPVLVVVYQGDKHPIYELGKKDKGLGLKEFSQRGDFAKLKKSLMAMKGVKAVYVAGTEPIPPMQKVMTQYKAEKGDKLAYATMFGFSNDWFYANDKPLDAIQISGDITASTNLFDSGTGVDQFPGAGNKQALFGGMPEVESNPIMKVGNKFPTPPVNKVLRITVK